MVTTFTVGKSYFGDFPTLTWDWFQKHGEDHIRTGKIKDSETVDCLFGDAIFVGRCSGMRCSYCNREIENGYEFVDESGCHYYYGPDCVKNGDVVSFEN